ncbi:MAG: sensor histidine kinase [Oscillospiraceae bacterium]
MEKKKFKLQKSSFHSKWSEVSIRFKLTAIMAVLSTCVLLIVSYAFYRVDTTERRAQAQSEKYYAMNTFIAQLQTSRETFASYVINPLQNKKAVQEDNVAFEALYEKFKEEDFSIQTVGKEQYLLARALKNTFSECIRSRNIILSYLTSQNITQASEYYNSKHIITEEYLASYADKLLLQILSDGQVFYATQQQTLTAQYYIATFLSVIILLCMCVFIYRLFLDITSPVIKISKAAALIADGNFDTPDVEVRYKDETYDLAEAFNRMKASMRQHIQTLNERNAMAHQLHIKDLEAAETDNLLQEAQMQMLRNQINPHFLFNTLNTISRTARMEHAEKSETLILSLSHLFRYSLKTDDLKVPLEREINIINDYITIQQTRFGSRVGMQWVIAPDVDIANECIPPFTFQPLVENAIIHGLEKKIEGGRVRIRIQHSADKLIIIVSDNGVGMDKKAIAGLTQKKPPAENGHHTGIGVANVAERLHMLYADCEFKVRSKLGLGTSITIKMNKENNKED